MKRITALLLVALFALCLAYSATTPSTGTPVGEATYSADVAASYQYQTSSKNKVVTVGTISGKLSGPVLITTFGQCTDYDQAVTAFEKKLKDVTIVANNVATVADLDGVKTVLIAVGASSKGLGAAGISQEQEIERAKALLEVIKKNGIKVICCHIGGAMRRGVTSDYYIDMVLPYSDYIIVKEDGNEDSKFTSFASANGIPVSLIYSSSGIVDALKKVF